MDDRDYSSNDFVNLLRLSDSGIRGRNHDAKTIALLRNPLGIGVIFGGYDVDIDPPGGEISVKDAQSRTREEWPRN